MLACAELNFSNFKFEYLRENEFLRKTILACLSGAQMGSIPEKNRSRKSRDTAPLSFLIPFVLCWGGQIFKVEKFSEGRKRSNNVVCDYWLPLLFKLSGGGLALFSRHAIFILLFKRPLGHQSTMLAIAYSPSLLSFLKYEKYQEKTIIQIVFFCAVSLPFLYEYTKEYISVRERTAPPLRLPNISPPNLSPRLLCQTVG